MKLNLLNIENLFNMPAFVYLKSFQGKYLTCNDYVGQHAGEKSHHIIGTTDFDHCWRDYAAEYQAADKKVIIEKKAIIIPEKIITANQEDRVILTYKMPMIHEKKIYVLGISYFLDQQDFVSKIFNQIELPSNHAPIFKENVMTENQSQIKLSDQQKNCLLYLVKGMTAKQMAMKLNLSFRTIEYHLNTLKTKFQCYSRSELINKALKLDFIQEKLLLSKS